jgi:serine/threonine protein kinase/tetratricopeptide (TPR) repeat protein
MAVDLRKIEEIFHVAMNVEPDDRADYLDSACEHDEDLRLEVESLVVAYESGSHLLDENAVTLAMRLMGSKSADSMVGQEVGSYRILGALGQGGMGAVYLAEDSRLNRKVALKFLSSDFVTDNWAKRQLIKEAQAVAMLDHPNICAVYDFEEIGDHSFIVMQYVEGQTLADLICKKSIRTDQIVPLAQQIVSALADAHAHGIIHRDIKPKNIMVTPSEQVKVLDFGLAKTIPKTFEDATESISQLSKDGLLVGTVAYMSPEQLRGEKLDFRSDLFSLGTVLYEMACGKNPYAHKTNAEVISAIMSREPQSLRQVSLNCPKDLEQIVCKCLQKDRAERYQSATELLIDLDTLHKGFTLPPPISTYLNIRYAALAAVLLLVFVVSIFVYQTWASAGHTLAVLPIQCEGITPPNQCLGPTVTENLVKALSHRRGLRVAESKVVPSLFGSQAATPQKIGQELNADIVMFGKITRSQNGYVLTTRLERVSDGSRIAEVQNPLNPDKLSWLEQWVSFQTAIQLQLPMNEEDKTVFNALAAQQNMNGDAAQLYSTGRVYWQRRDGENIQRAIDNFTQATEIDPSYAQAWAGLADCYVLMNTVRYGDLASSDSMMKAEAAAKQAIRLNDNLAEAHNAYASVLMKGHWDWDNAEKEFKRAIALEPDYSPAHWGYSALLAHTGRIDEALVESERARELDPFYPAAALNHCRNLYFARQIDQADTCLNDIAKDHPNYSTGNYMHGLIYLAQGKIQEATQIYEAVYANDKRLGGAMLGYCYAIANRRADAERVLNEMQALQNQPHSLPLPPQELAIIYLGLGDLDHAFPLFQKAADEKYPPLMGIFIDPLFDRYRSDPRFVELAREVKLPSHPLSSSPASTSSAK